MSNLIAVSKENSDLKIAAFKDGFLWQLFYQSPLMPSYIDNIYLGRITMKTPTFIWIDIGLNAPAALRPSPSNNKLREGQKILVQVCQDIIEDKVATHERKTKSLRVTTTIHLAGRYCIYHPHHQGLFFSDKFDKQLKDNLLEALKDRANLTIRSSCAFLKDKSELLKEIDQFCTEWENLNEVPLTGKPRLIKSGLTDLEKLLRDLSPAHKVIFDDVSALAQAKEFLQKNYPPLLPQLHQGSLKELPLFESLGIAESWDSLSSPLIPVSSGGNLYIEETACLTMIDVNGYKTGVKYNALTALLIVTQIRLRRLSGNIIIDFIRVPPKQRKELLKTFEGFLNRENTQKLKVMGWSNLGFLELQGPRYQDSLPKQLSKSCANCDGSGRVLKI
jgi:Rne/Rng family ribonuclease